MSILEKSGANEPMIFSVHLTSNKVVLITSGAKPLEIVLRVDGHAGARVVGEVERRIGETPQEEANVV